MGTLDTRGGSPISPDINMVGPSSLVESVLSLLEAAGIPSEANNSIVEIIEVSEFKLIGSRFAPKGNLVHRECPACTCEMSFDSGEVMTREGTGEGPLTFCECCGHEEASTEADIQLFSS